MCDGGGEGVVGRGVSACAKKIAKCVGFAPIATVFISKINTHNLTHHD